MEKKMLTLLPGALETRKLHGYLLGAVGPRPIALASTVDADGNPNLSPFSFFNVFSSNPPILIFSPSRRVRDNTVKDTLENVRQVPEVVINTVSYGMVQQMSLSSTEYPRGVNEFRKAGFGMLPSQEVRPWRVAGAPAQFECRVTEIKPLGDQGGAGNLIFCEVVALHLDPEVLGADGMPDPALQDLVARMGGNWYNRASSGLFEVPKPLSHPGIGVDGIPPEILHSNVLTGNHLGLLGNVDRLPDPEAVAAFVAERMDVRGVLSSGDKERIHEKAREFLDGNDVSSAWKTLLASTEN
ncbi:flavin reductase family protein [Robiginitalea sp. M366]|uniref:flavin reductase family protein n=1 Tax=Robiginitalea aestuariiviva TaxID=3036903 RepID=UPI00240D2E07|nr:flavin reductase family protein [Robiginitalea aestuariiviva]MDG1571737.1 flavin reductase family protein [Robiginitalea aestuariiviva]